MVHSELTVLGNVNAKTELSVMPHWVLVLADQDILEHYVMKVRFYCCIYSTSLSVIPHVTALLKSYLACPPGFFGLNCVDKCACGRNGRCDHVAGRCLHDSECPAGKTGLGCLSSKYIKY